MTRSVVTLCQAVLRQKRLYDKRAVCRLFVVGDWTLRYYPPAKKCKLDLAWVGPYLVVSLAGWAVGIQLQPDSPIILVHCQDLKKIPRPSGLVSWIDAAHPVGLPSPPVLCASTMGRSTWRSLSISEEGSLLSGGASVVSARLLPGSLSYHPKGSVMDVSSGSLGTMVTFLPQEVLLVDSTIKPQSDERLRLPTTCDYLRPAVIVGSRSDFYHNRTSSHTLRSLYDRSSMIVTFWSLCHMQVADCCTTIVRPSYESLRLSAISHD